MQPMIVVVNIPDLDGVRRCCSLLYSREEQFFGNFALVALYFPMVFRAVRPGAAVPPPRSEDIKFAVR